jgi:hypothetical protein
VAGVQRADEVAGPHRPALGHRRRHRLVRGAQAVGVVDADDPAAGHLTREPDHARPGRVHGCARLGGQIDAAVSGQPRPRRRIEPAHHRRAPIERPAKPGTLVDRPAEAGTLVDRPAEAGTLVDRPAEAGTLVDRPAEAGRAVSGRPA